MLKTMKGIAAQGEKTNAGCGEQTRFMTAGKRDEKTNKNQQGSKQTAVDSVENRICLSLPGVDVAGDIPDRVGVFVCFDLILDLADRG